MCGSHDLHVCTTLLACTSVMTRVVLGPKPGASTLPSRLLCAWFLFCLTKSTLAMIAISTPVPTGATTAATRLDFSDTPLGASMSMTGGGGLGWRESIREATEPGLPKISQYC